MEEWANDTLNQQELEQFKIAYEENESQWNTYYIQGLISQTDIVETAFSSTFNTNVEIKIGHKIIVTNNEQTSSVVTAPSFVPWVDRYNYEIGNPVVRI
jgi:ribosomal protein S8E